MSDAHQIAAEARCAVLTLLHNQHVILKYTGPEVPPPITWVSDLNGDIDRIIEAAIEKAMALPDERWVTQQLQAANKLIEGYQREQSNDTKERDPFNEDEWPDDSPAGRAPQTELPANYIRLFIECISHGDDEHRLWLKSAGEAFIKGEPMPDRPCPCLQPQSDDTKRLDADHL